MCDISCEGREDSENSTSRCQCSYALLWWEQPSAVGGLRQTRSNFDDPCLENANKSRAEGVWCLEWKCFYPNSCQDVTQTLISFTYTMNPEKNVSFAVRILSCPVMWWLAEAAQDTAAQGYVTTENDLIIIVFHLTAEPATCCVVWLANYILYGLWDY